MFKLPLANMYLPRRFLPPTLVWRNLFDMTDDPDTYLLYNPDDIRFVSGGVDTVKILPNEVSVNDGSAAIDFRVESDNTNTNIISVLAISNVELSQEVGQR